MYIYILCTCMPPVAFINVRMCVCVCPYIGMVYNSVCVSVFVVCAFASCFPILAPDEWTRRSIGA